MKKLTLIAALLCLAVSGAAVAQQDMGNMATSGATYATGEVQANAVDSITVKEDNGQVVTFLIDDKTVGALGHPSGSRVRINFHRNDLDQGVADEIQGVGGDAKVVVSDTKVVSEPVMPSGPAIEQPKVAAPEPIAATEPVYTEPVVKETVVTEPAVETASTEPLPATASHLHELALLGLLALSAAAAIRVSR